MKIPTNDYSNQRNAIYSYNKVAYTYMNNLTIASIRSTYNITSKNFIILSSGLSSMRVKRYSDGTTYTCDMVVVSNNKAIGYKYDGQVFDDMYYVANTSTSNRYFVDLI